jgi:D-alanine-D-alanine ligase
MANRRVLTKKQIGVLMGGQSSEREISLRTGRAVHQSLLRRGYRAVAIDVSPNLYRDVAKHKVELAFLALHGPGGEDGTIQGFLETLGIPYTGSGVQASAMGMHKVTTKTLAVSAHVPVPAGTQVRRGEQPSLAMVLKAAKLALPVVVKPASQGSTIGVSIVRKPGQWKEALALAHRYDPDAMVEAYIPGHETTVSIWAGRPARSRSCRRWKSWRQTASTIFQRSIKKAKPNISVRLRCPPRY